MRTSTLPDLALAQALAGRRQRLGKPQHVLAREAGIPAGTLTNYELGRSPIPPDRLAAIERALAQAERRQAIVEAALQEAAV